VKFVQFVVAQGRIECGKNTRAVTHEMSTGAPLDQTVLPK
jgi:hypothetical protein